MNPKKLVIASRESLLAMWQAKHIQGRLKTLYPDCEVEILGMTTRGDQILDKTLSKIGGKGLFIKELEQALQDGRADLADKENAEIAVLQGYLPEMLSAEAIAAEVAKAVAETGASGMADMGKVMGLLKTRLAGKADMGEVNKALKAELS